MPAETIRIISDVHFGDHGSGVRSLRQLAPLADGAGELVLNGDTLDTRAGPDPGRTAAHLAGVREFIGNAGPRTTCVTGNHDPDISRIHACELADGRVLVTHGDVVFDEIVPWGRDAGLIRRRLRDAWAGPAERSAATLDERLRVWRRVAATVAQRHQSEQNPLKYALRLAADTVWPPWRPARILGAWRVQPRRIAALARRHRPGARFVIVGHTHWPGVWAEEGGITVINTGSFCGPFGALAVDLGRGRISVRRIGAVRGEYRPGGTVREFALAAAAGAVH